MDWSAVVEAQRRYFRSGATLSFDFRRLQLENLRRVLRENEPAIERPSRRIWRSPHSKPTPRKRGS